MNMPDRTQYYVLALCEKSCNMPYARVYVGKLEVTQLGQPLKCPKNLIKFIEIEVKIVLLEARKEGDEDYYLMSPEFQFRMKIY